MYLIFIIQCCQYGQYNAIHPKPVDNNKQEQPKQL